MPTAHPQLKPEDLKARRTNVLRELERSFSDRPDVLSNPQVYGLVGERGSGKSLAMGIFLAEEYAAGRDVFYFPPEYGFKFGRPLDAATLASVPDYLENAAIGIDEINLLMSRYAVTSIRNQLMAGFFQQIRKRNVNVYWTTNSPQRMDQVINTHTDFHATVRLYTDARCKALKKHRTDCGDQMVVRWTDTQGKKRVRRSMANGRKADTRARGYFYRRHIWLYYRLFETGARFDAKEAFRLTRDRLLESEADRQGLTREDLVYNAVIEYQMAGHDYVTSSQIAEAIRENYQESISAHSVGRYLRKRFNKVKSNGEYRWTINPSLVGDLSASS